MRANLPLLSAAALSAVVFSTGCTFDATTDDAVGKNQPAPPVPAAPVPTANNTPPPAAGRAHRELAADETRQNAPAAAGMLRRHALVALPGLRPPSADLDRERYADLEANGVQLVSEHPVSTFSVDVDTGAYALVRRQLNQGRLPPTDAVRTEELVNYFGYDYPPPADRETPFSVTTEIAPTPWNASSHLVHVGLQGYELPADRLPPANLVFLVDVSGSMNSPDKLPLLKNALRLLVERLRPADRVGIVVYAGATGVVLESTPGDRKAEIIAALDRLSAGGPTHGAAGLELAYRLVEQHRVPAGINRVILATDGDFNVGVVDHDRLVDLIERRREAGISLTTLGFGSGNYNDHLMEQLADRGNGNYAYIDTLNEARKVLVEEMSATLETIASDVKIQVEWNPAQVAEYRLIGYENRGLRREDFNNDAVDAGEIGAGHSVTALYEVTLAGQAERRIEPLRYGGRQVPDAAHSDELGFLRLRYRLPGADRSRLIEQALPVPAASARWQDASPDFRFSAAVAAFAERLRGGTHAGGADYPLILDLARQARGDDASGYRGEFLQLVKLAQTLSQNLTPSLAPSLAPGQATAAGPAGSGEVAGR